ncbi:DUF2237 family protein [Sediminitomix flava]|uniref:DUF2237 family protein n=1 Tax=Sediminitomix flava TaxID=379075 RepID=A0A315ZBH5_SEDFL|nr:DUF2237 domain-containing protein [Sediminitomix flava]PWJ42652.1 hypothetical protein BC781_102196 [Sediminitomix flava]
MLSENVFGDPLELCCTSPMTGFFRNGSCETCEEDRGVHVVCAVMTDEFLQFSKKMGNDLMTARPEYQFPGLKAGDSWCLCAFRWKEAWLAGCPPEVYLKATNKEVLVHIPLEVLQKYAVDYNIK